MLIRLLLVGFGGFAGSMLRYLVSLGLGKHLTSELPAGTFLINLLGSFIIGLLFGMVQRSPWLQGNGWLLLATGFCGGFTTFSAFALENVNLFHKQLSLTAFAYIGLSLALGLLLCRAGVWLGSLQ